MSLVVDPADREKVVLLTLLKLAERHGRLDTMARIRERAKAQGINLDKAEAEFRRRGQTGNSPLQ